MLQQSPSPGVDEYVSGPALHFHAFGEPKRAAVDAVEAVGLHVMREAAGQPMRTRTRSSPTQSLVAAQLCTPKNGIVAAAVHQAARRY